MIVTAAVAAHVFWAAVARRALTMSVIPPGAIPSIPLPGRAVALRFPAVTFPRFRSTAAAATAPTAVRLGPIDGIKPRHIDGWYRVTDQFLDCLDGEAVIRLGDRKGVALQPRSAGAANPMNIVFRVVRHVEIEHVRQPADIQSTSRDVAADQKLQLIRLELLKRCEPHRLRHVAMQRAHTEPMLAQ